MVDSRTGAFSSSDGLRENKADQDPEGLSNDGEGEIRSGLCRMPLQVQQIPGFRLSDFGTDVSMHNGSCGCHVRPICGSAPQKSVFGS
jgi:hypothetical protein